MSKSGSIFNNYSPKANWILVNIHEPEANNCFSIISQVIIEIPKQRIDRKMLNFICHSSHVSEQLHPLICSHRQQTISLVISPVFPPDWDIKLRQTFIHLVYPLKLSGKFGLLLKPFCYINKVLRKFNSCFDLLMHIIYRHKRLFHGNLNGFFVTFSRIFASYLWRVLFRT